MATLTDAVREAGVIGAGGAGFPTHVKLDTEVDLVVVNGAECEPLLNSDQRVMEHFPGEMVDGLRLIMKQVGASRGVIGVKAKYKPAIRALEAAIAGHAELDICQLGNFYPAGDEQILLTEINGKVVPEAGLPLHVGAVVSNVLTMVQVSGAARGIPVTERPVTLVGDIEEPQVITCPIGTPVRDLLRLAKPKLPLDQLAIIDGGPMMGRIVDIDATINKTTSGLIFLPQDHDLIQLMTIPLAAIIRRSVAACCQCRECTELCSRYMQGHRIEPHLMMRGLWELESRLDQPAFYSAFLCSQCGLCEYACPMNLSPRRGFAEVGRRLRAAGESNPLRAAPEQPHEFRPYRKVSKDRLTRRYQLLPYESFDLPLRTMTSPPARVGLSLSQAAGAPAQPVVEVGQAVALGTLVAAIPEGKLGANLHASIDGVVTQIDDKRIVIAS